MFFKQVEKLCQNKGISITKLISDIGLSCSNATYWKNGSIPRANTLKKISDYFNVTTESLLAKTYFAEDVRDADGKIKETNFNPSGDPYILLSEKARKSGISPETLEKLIDLYTKK
jgi:transcriptional regulator with XRE-family HTH domain